MLSPFMENTISQYMVKCCDEVGTLYITGKQNLKGRELEKPPHYKVTMLATPKVFLRSKDLKILEHQNVQSLPIANWGVTIIRGDFKPDPNFTIITEEANVSQDKKHARGMCNQLYRM